MRLLKKLVSPAMLGIVTGVTGVILVTALELSAAPNSNDEEGELFTGYSVMCYVVQDGEYKITPSDKVKNEFENMISVFREFAFDSDGEQVLSKYSDLVK